MKESTAVVELTLYRDWYPDTQRMNEETTAEGAIDQFIAKRAKQKWGLLDELVHFIRYMRNDPKSDLKRI